jgi:ketosteroid isomerase-like protein
MNAAEIVTAYWKACRARDWAAFGELLADDVVYELPQSRERIRGRANYVQFNAEYPGDWDLEPVRITGDARHAASWIRFVIVGEDDQTGVCFFDLDDAGRIAHISDFWPKPYEPPRGREHLTELY